jgi:hypothetical protein
MEKTNFCRNCQHWTPHWTGEQWGVRSFIEGPEEDRSFILAELLRRETDNSYFDTFDLGESEHNPSYYGALGENWPEWGKCNLTELGNDLPTLAKAIDGSEYYAVLCTHANFSCIQFSLFTMSDQED